MSRKPKQPPKVKYPTRRSKSKEAPLWDAERVKALREFMGLTQTQFAEELGNLQQTVSQWECGNHYPKGASVKVLSMVAETANFKYGEATPGAKSELGS